MSDKSLQERLNELLDDMGTNADTSGDVVARARLVDQLIVVFADHIRDTPTRFQVLRGDETHLLAILENELLGGDEQ